MTSLQPLPWLLLLSRVHEHTQEPHAHSCSLALQGDLQCLFPSFNALFFNFHVSYQEDVLLPNQKNKSKCYFNRGSPPSRSVLAHGRHRLPQEGASQCHPSPATAARKHQLRSHICRGAWHPPKQALGGGGGKPGLGVLLSPW